MSEYVKKIAAEEFAAQIAKSFSSSDSPYGHVDAEQVCSCSDPDSGCILFMHTCTMRAHHLTLPSRLPGPSQIVGAFRTALQPRRTAGTATGESLIISGACAMGPRPPLSEKVAPLAP